MITRPMLAATVEDISQLDGKYPLLATPKIDGIRCLVFGWRAVSRTFKPIPNHFIRNTLEQHAVLGYYDLDGELVVGKNFQETASGVMSEEGEPDFKYVVFDGLSDTHSYEFRINRIHRMQSVPFYTFLYPVQIDNREQLDILLAAYLATGYEGIMLRTPNSPYKCGRSTLKEGYLMKLKPFADGEAVVVGFLEKMHNANRQTSDNFGLAKRSHRGDNMMPEDTLGSLIVKDVVSGVEFCVGSGFDDNLRAEVWQNQDKYSGRVITYKYQKHGMKDKPRSPVFKCFRKD